MTNLLLGAVALLSAALLYVCLQLRKARRRVAHWQAKAEAEGRVSQLRMRREQDAKSALIELQEAIRRAVYQRLEIDDFDFVSTYGMPVTLAGFLTGLRAEVQEEIARVASRDAGSVP